MKKCILLMAVVLLLCGCSRITNTSEEEKAELQKEETLWKVLDSKENVLGYLAEDCQDVEQIKEKISKHCEYVDNRSAKDLSIKKEMELYSEEFRTSLQNGGYEDNVKKMYEDNQLALESKQIIWYPSTFDEDIQYAKVTVDAEFVLTAGKEDYLTQNKMSLNTLYIEQRIYYLEKDNGIWEITNIKKSALDKQE